MSDRQRREVLEAVLQLRHAPKELAAMVAKIPWDAERPLVIATRSGLRRVLQDVVDRRIPIGHVQPWAELLESRDDVGRERGHETILNECLFELASPSLTGLEIDALVRRWVRRLG